MKLYKLDAREIRSFRLRYRTLELKSFFENKQSFGLFIMTETIQPKDRIEKQLNPGSLQMTNISKKISKFLTKQQNWTAVQNLLAGNVVVLKNKSQTPLSPDILKKILQKPQTTPRFLFWNETIYREKSLAKYIESTNINPHLTLIQLIRKISLTPLYATNPFLIRQN